MEEIKKSSIINTLASLTNQAAMFIKGEIGEREIDSFLDKLNIKMYLPMMEKYRIMFDVVLELKRLDIQIPELFIMEKYKLLFFKVLLKEFCSIDMEDSELVTFQNYDLLFPVFYDKIMHYCEDDYKNLVGMIDQSLELRQAMDIMGILNDIDYSTIIEANNSNKELLETMMKNKTMIKDLKELMKFIDPTTQMINGAVKIEAKEATKKSKKKK